MIKEYFKKFIECITLEQSEGKERVTSTYTNANRETGLKITKINSNGKKGTIVVLQKETSEDLKPSELTDRTFVNLITTNNISFNKGCIIVKNMYTRVIEPLQKFQKLSTGARNSIQHKDYY